MDKTQPKTLKASLLGAIVLSLSLGAQTGRAEGWADITILDRANRDVMNPCHAYRGYLENAGDDNAFTGSFKQLCETVGEHIITRECVDYFIQRRPGRAFAASEATVAKLAAECDATMPGVIAVVDSTAGGPDAAMVVEPMDMMECGEGMAECREPDFDTATEPVAPEDDPHTDDHNVDVPEPEAPQAKAENPAMELAFWNSIKDSANPVLFQAYLDKFTDGVFAPIAREMIKTLSAPQADTSVAPVAPAQAPKPAQSSAPTAPAQLSPEQLFEQGQNILQQAFSKPVAVWNREIRPAVPLFEKASKAGHAPSWYVLGELYENGNGVAKSNDTALRHYLRAGDLGNHEGYARALLVQDQLGRNVAFVRTFLKLYGVNDTLAIDRLGDYSRKASIWLQRDLKTKGYYHGALDGDFGSNSQTALRAFVNGFPPPPKPAAKPKVVATATIAAQLQRQLKRVGCYQGAIDGQWGTGSKQALRNFNMWGPNTGTTDPTAAALRIVKNAKAPVCGVD